MKEIELTQGKVALVDDADFDWLSAYKWHAVNNRGRWYAARGIYDPTTQKVHTSQMHREIMKAGAGQQIDHWNRDGLDNRKANLRLCNDAENNANTIKRAGCSSQYKGVSWDAPRHKWRAHIGVLGRLYHLGGFDDEIRAGRAYDEAAREHFGEFARLNFPRAGEQGAIS